MRCRYCGEELPNGSNFCWHCGAKLISPLTGTYKKEEGAEPQKDAEPRKCAELQRSAEPRKAAGPQKDAEPWKAAGPQKDAEPRKAAKPQRSAKPRKSAVLPKPVKRKKKPRILGGIFLLCLMVLAGVLIWKLVLKPGVGGSADTQSEQAGISLLLDRSMFYAGEEPKETQATILCGEDISGTVRLLDDQEQELASVPVDGSGSYEVSVEIAGDTARVGRLRAEADKEVSEEVVFCIQPRVTEEMMLTLMETAEDLNAYMVESSPADYYSEETFKLVSQWLLQDERVAAAECYPGCVLYVTKDGLAGSYGMNRYEPGFAGESTLEEVYQKNSEGKNLADCYIPSVMTLTNTNLLMLSPDVGDGEFDEMRSVSEKALNRLASKIGGQVIKQEGLFVASVLGQGNYVDNGLVMLSTHGNVIDAGDTGNILYFQLGEMNKTVFEGLTAGEEGASWGDFASFTGTGGNIWDSLFGGTDNITPENYRLVYDVTPDAEDVYTVRGTRNYISQGLSNKIFDNTLLYFGVCFGAADSHLIQTLRSHGASAFIGTKDSFNIMYIGVLMEELAEVLGNNSTAEEYRGLSSLHCVRNLSDEEHFLEAYCRYLADVNDTTYEEVSTNSEEAFIPWVEDSGTQMRTPRQVSETLREYIAELGADYIANVYSFHSTDFSMTGQGTFSVKVINKDKKPIEGAQVMMYRWLDHQLQQTGSGLTDEDGMCSLEKLPYGLYVAVGSMGSANAYATMEFGKYTEDTAQIILELCGFTGTVVDAEEGYPIVGASVQYTMSEEATGVLTDENGRFTALNMQPGTYTIAAGKKGYEDSEPVSVEVKEGSLTELKEIPVEKILQSEDTWGAVNGMSGTVEYEYDEEGRVTQMSLFNQENGMLYRRLTYEYEPGAGGGAGIRRINTYSGNNILLYELSEIRNGNGYLDNTSGYDFFKEEASSSQRYTGGESEQVEYGELKEYRYGSDNYWICHYSKNGLSQRDFYYKDAAHLASEIYEYEEDGSSYSVHLEEGGLTSGYFTPVFNENGQLIEYRDKFEDTPQWSFTYDEEGRLLVSTRYNKKGEHFFEQALSYGEDGKLAQCYYHWGESNGTNDFTFTYKNGFLVYREGISQSIGNGDIAAMQYEYYDSGALKRLICYSGFEDSYEYSDPENLEYVYTFYEDGTLKAVTDYDYCYDANPEDEGTSGRGFRDCMVMRLYRPDGTLKATYDWAEETEKARGTLEICYFDTEGKVDSRKTEDYHGQIQAEGDLEMIYAAEES